MAEKKFSELPSAASLTGNELAALSQMQSGSLASVKSTLQAIANWFAVYAQYTTALQTTDKSIAGALNELKQKISLIPKFSIDVVQTLPTEDISDTTIYLVPSDDPETENAYDEYINLTGTTSGWEKIGSTDIDMSAYYTKLEVDGLLEDKLEADDFEANQTASANPITLETKQAGLAKSCVVEMNPIQDLHGYSNPWAGGAGKNKINVSGQTQSSGFRIIPAQTPWDFPYNTTYTFSCKLNASNDGAVQLTYRENGKNKNVTQSIVSGDNNITLTFTPQSTTDIWTVYCNVGGTVSDIQLEIGSTATTFAPYSNICPISGRTEVSVNQGSVNIDTLYNGQIQSDGTFTWNNNRLSNANKANMNTYLLKKGTHTLTFKKLNQSAPDLVECTVLTKNDTFEIVDNFATAWHSLPYTFELTADAYVYFTARKNYNTALNTADYKTLIIDETHTHQYGQTVYGGEDDFVNGGLANEWVLAEYDGTENWLKASSATWVVFFVELADEATGLVADIRSDSTNISVYSFSQMVENAPCVSIRTNITPNRLHIAIPNVSTISECKAYLAEHNLQVCYKKATPTTIQLSPEAVTLLKGLNVISTDGDKVQVEFSDIPVGDYSVLLGYIKSLEARIAAVEP